MSIITKKELAELSAVNQENCVSIFIPTHRAGEKVLQGVDALKLKNQLLEVKEKLEKRGFHTNEIEVMTAPVQQLINDTSFWRRQSDGLAIFLTNDFFKVYTVPVYFEGN